MNRPQEGKDSESSQYPAEVYTQSINVPFEYPVIFTRRLFAGDNPLPAAVMDRLGEKRRHRAAAYVDSEVARAHPGFLEQMKEYFHARPNELELTPPTIVPGGESVKTGWQVVREVMWTIGSLHLDRQSFVIAVGGGAVLDMVGFAASIVHRGLRLLRVPTTTLAQGDGGVGVKNGMDEHGQKNFVGTFAPPFAVLNDLDFLETLSDRDWIGGVAEAFKVAIIKDAAFFDFLCEHAAALRARDEAAMAQTVRRCAILHLEHIRTSGDAFEFGSARPLDFGHWIGHKIETMSGYAIGHGQAAAIGVAADSYYAMRRGLLGTNDLERIIEGLLACGLPIWDEHLGARTADGTLEILDGLERFREHLGGRLTVTLPHGIGARTEVHQMDPGVIDEAAGYLKDRAAQAGRA